MATSESITLTERVLWAPKAGQPAEAYEDAALASQAGTWPVRAAVADGATESAYAGRWANHLVRGFVEKGPVEGESFREELASWREACEQEIREQVSEEDARWYQTAKAEEGAYATMLGLVLHAEGTWQALSVGDCCLFQLRAGAVQQCWPWQEAAQFGNRPELVSSRSDQPLPTLHTQEGTWQPGDAFVLATDALAAWLLAHDATEELLTTAPDAFQETVEAARADSRLRNDDVTALILKSDNS